MTSNNVHILCVDDDSNFLNMQKELLGKEENFEVYIANSVKDAFKLLNKNNIDIIVSDYDIPDKDGISFLKELQQETNKIPFILLTGKGREEVVIQALNFGAYRYIKKGIDIISMNTELIHSIKQCYRQKELQRFEIKNNELYFNLFELSPDGIVIVDTTGKILKVNSAFLKITGFSKDEIAGKHFTKIGPMKAKELPKFLKLFSTMLLGKKVESFEFDFSRKNGTTGKGQGIAYKIKWRGQNKIFQVYLRDISDQKTIHDSLIEIEQKYTALIESTSDQIFMINKDYKILSINKIGAKYLNKSKEDIISKSIFHLFPKEFAIDASKYVAKVFKSGKSVIGKSKLEIGGTIIWWSSVFSPVSDHSGKIFAVSAVARNITDQIKLEQLLKYSEEKYRDIVENSQDMIFQCDLKGNQIFINDTWAKEHGYKVEDMQDKPFQDFVEPEALKRDMVVFKKILEGGSVKNHYTTHLTKNGDPIHLIFNAQPLYNEKKQIIGTKGSAINITEQVNMKKKLMENEEKYRAIVENSPNAIFIFQSGYIVYSNTAFTDMFGFSFKNYSKSDFDNMTKIFVKNQSWNNNVENITKRLEGKNIPRYETILDLKKGNKVEISVFGKKIMYNNSPAIIYILTDVSEISKLKSEKINLMKKISKSLSHDIRSPLSAISSASYMLQTDSGNKKKKLLELIDKSILIADNLLQDVLDFEKEIKLHLTKVDVYNLIEDTISGLFVPINIEIINIKKDSLFITGDNNKLKRVFMNILLNSIQAMPKGGKITITSAVKNDMLEISITDTGKGISPENLKNIFIPYNTTKINGTGLGIVGCDNIIKTHKGILNITSIENKGTTVTIKLPLE